MSQYSFTTAQYNELFRYALALCECRQQGFDMLHDTMLTWATLDQQGVENPVAYVKRAIRNTYYDQLKQVSRRRELLDQNQSEAALFTQEQALEQLVIDRVTLERVWQDLRADEREILFLWAVDGYSAREIGLQLKMPRASILSKMHRMRLRFHDDLEERGQQ